METVGFAHTQGFAALEHYRYMKKATR